ncbi:hypothetical protein HG264_12965 [Pseudomonas sp. gcc21]|uniref:hypothetical protein n=1 Tax=Pseudomonas sp. gcc21 TaxID=2726989 RepID=UPI00145115B6|nr:hypothetical protein [Pseudomonas sp. gcc21]QJD59751.1 hypothetical protein HG264_12965 [Pseudomonas sp. gcc21]
MNMKKLLFVICVTTALGGCASVSSSSVAQVAVSEQTVGPIFIMRTSLPSDVEYEVIGQIKANARTGYDNVESLYPMLAEEARKVGANAIVDVYGGRTVSAFSWAAPFTGGTAVSVEDPSLLNALDGRFVE